jgi:hypothetical protein
MQREFIAALANSSDEKRMVFRSSLHKSELKEQKAQSNKSKGIWEIS